MAEVYTFDEQGMRKLVAAFRELSRQHSNQNRKLAHYSTRRHEAVYLPGAKTEIVQVVHPSETTGEVVLANASGVHPGYVATANEYTLDRGDACWILFVDAFDTDDGLVPAVNEEYYGPAKHSGSYSVSTDERPLYVVHRGDIVDIVQVLHSGESQYELVAANGDGVHPGKVKRVVEGAMTTPGDCWILFVDEFPTAAGVVPAVNEEFYGPARLSGSFTSGAVELPLYVVRRGSVNLWYLGLVREKYTQGETSHGVYLDLYVRDLVARKWRKLPGSPLEAEDWFLQKEETLEKKTKVRVDWYINCWVVTDMHCSPTDLDEFKDTPSPGGSPGEHEQEQQLGGFGEGTYGGATSSSYSDRGLPVYEPSDAIYQGAPSYFVF